MSGLQIIFAFTISLNIFTVLIAGIDRYLKEADSQVLWSEWIVTGALALLLGSAAFAVRLVADLIPQGNALFLPMYAALAIATYYLVKNTVVKSGSVPGELVKRVSRCVASPQVLVPVMYIGYSGMSYLESLLVVLATWIGGGVMTGVFLALRRHLDLETYRLGEGLTTVLLLSIALSAMIFSAIDDAFFSLLYR